MSGAGGPGSDAKAEALVLVFSAGVSLDTWRKTGMLGREWALYRELATSGRYARFVLVTFGETATEETIAAGLSPAPTVIALGETAVHDAPRSTGRAAERVVETVRGCASAIVKTNQMDSGPWALAIADALRRAGVRVGLVARGGYPLSRFAAWEHGPDSREAMNAGAIEGELCRGADFIVGTTSSMVDDLSWRHGIDPARCTVVPNYVEVDSGPATPPGPGARRDETTILYAGRLTAQKRVAMLIEAMAKLPERWRSSAKLEIIGEGPLEAELRRLAERLTVSVRFEARIAHDELMKRMDRCAVYAQCSAYEGHPKTVIEAMSRGCAVAVVRAPGLSDVVDDRRAGAVCDADASSVARSLAALLDNAELRTMLGRTAAERVRDRYALAGVVDLELSAHQRALERGGAAGTQAAPVVRWSPELLAMEPPAAAGAFEGAVRGYLKRVDPARGIRTLMTLDARLYEIHGDAAKAAEPGELHPKHRLMRYHDFFTARIKPGERVIDLGCGVGALAVSIATKCGATVTGIDLSKANLDRAASVAAKAGVEHQLELLEGDITTTRASGRGGWFDVVVLSNVLEHLKDRAKLLRMWAEWYSPRAFLIRVPAFDRDWRVPLKKELGVEWRLDPTHETEYSREQLEGELREGGLKISECLATWGEYWLSAEIVKE
ncbi:MAG TPA: glycosyltransferase [Phycisphaerales bacterium]|nr:glycosyltransferase [Phycisphaerales bacterium]